MYKLKRSIGAFTWLLSTEGIANIGSLRNHDGYGDENVTSNKFELSFQDVSILFMLYNMGKVSYHQIGM